MVEQTHSYLVQVCMRTCLHARAEASRMHTWKRARARMQAGARDTPALVQVALISAIHGMMRYGTKQEVLVSMQNCHRLAVRPLPAARMFQTL